MGVEKKGLNLKSSAKKAVILVSGSKNQISPLLAIPLKTFWKNPLVALPGKNPSDAHAHKYVKLHLFL